MKHALSISLASLLLAGSAQAAEKLRISSEEQFAREYADRIELMAPGVYQIVKGPLAGKLVSLGEAGLDHDLTALRARVPTSVRERAVIQARIKRLENTRARYSKLHQLQARDTTRASTSSTLPCYYYNPRTNSTIYYSAFATVEATTEYYMSNGGGGLNPYYARASASAFGSVSRPGNVPYGSGMVSIYALAWNHDTSTLNQYFNYGAIASGGTGYVYSGPVFSHNLEATAGVEGEGDCFGYVSISDTLR